MSSLEDRIIRIENIEAIRNLKQEIYCHCIDLIVAGKQKQQIVLDHLTEDVIADFTGFSLMEGKSNVADFLFRKVPSILSYSQHRVSNDVIKIQGKKARALWYVDCPVVFRPGNKLGIKGSAFIAGRYEEKYVYQDGRWKWAEIVALLDTVQQFDKNWANARQIIKNR